MSAEEFIYSVINTDNVAQLDLNVIANTLASADSLIRQIKAQQVENEGLKEKIASLRTSALQIKQLYEAEVGKNQGIVNREEDYVRKVKELEARTSAAENARINAELQEKETVAELERKADHWRDKYDSLALDMVRNCSLLVDNSLLPTDQQMKFRDWKCHVQSMVQDDKEVPEDVLACLNKKRASRKKRKLEVDCRDQATMTVGPMYTTIGVNAVEEKPSLSSASTSTQDLEPPTPQYSITNDSFSEETSKEEPPKKTFANKSTMYSSSTVTRSTCTSAFIKRVDVGVNFPEVVPKSINEILRECVIELPSLLSPILDDISVRSESTSTQTDSLPDAIEPKPQLVTIGTVTNLRNIRRKLDFVRKVDGILGSQLLSNIKKEESISPASSMQNLPSTVFQSEDLGGVNPQLTHIWGLLGETMFRLLGTGRMFDSQCYNTINERIAMINSLIDSESRRGTAMMSEVFAAAAASAALASSRDQVVGKKSVVDPVDRVPVSRGKCMQDYEKEVDPMSGEDDDEGSNGPWDIECPEADEGLESNIESVPRDEQMEQEEPAGDSSCVTEDAPEVAIDPEPTPSVDNADAACNASTAAEQLPAEDSKQTKDSLISTPHEDDATISDCPVAVVPQEALPPPVPVFFDVPSPPLTEESNDCGSTLLEPMLDGGDSKAKDGDERQQQQQPEEVEHDELENELRLMEEGIGIQPTTVFQVPNLEQIETRHYLDVVCDDESVSTTDDENECRMMIVETSPSRLSSASSSCTSIGSNGTLISPIKVKETNELVKDQFKTPTSPAISKRKLRERLEAGHSKRGRLSPTTESLLEDDWDRKFTRIKDYFTLPSSLNPIEDGSARRRQVEEEDEEDCWEFSPVEQFDEDDEECFTSAEQQFQPLTVETDEDEPMMALTDSPESPVEEPPVSFGSSSWDDFKKPLSIDIGDPSLGTDSASDSPESPVLSDSPLSPMPECPNVVSRCFSRDESPLSPPLESRPSMYADSLEPKIIPLENPLASRTMLKIDNTPIGKSIAWYNNARRAEVLLKMASNPPKKEGQLIRRVVEVIEAYVQDEWTVDNLNLRCAQLLEVSDDTRILCQAIVDCVVSYADLQVDVQCSPPAPPLPRTTQQLVLLAKTLNETLFTLDRIIMQEIDRRVFQLKSDKIKLDTITAMTYLYVGVADCNRLYGCTARMYIYKCLYYFNFKGLPLIYYVLKAFPHALPKKASVHYDNSDAMVSTIRTILMNTNYIERIANNPDAHMYKKCELLKLLKHFYGYQQGCPTYEELITNLIEKIKANKLKNVDYCLILVAKRKGYDWAKQNIVQKHLYPLLNDYLKQIDSEGTHDEQICCLIFSISAILKTQPNYQDVTGVMQILGSIVQKTDGNRRVQEAAVAGLMRFTRFNYADVYEWLCRWCPSYEVSGRTKLMLATFVHRKERSFWQQLGQRAIV
ncbi:uncharacterized protein Ice1 [Ochlerotatus camptorhynchus]|uniref:uncharacterized protein Ice1 n=1 Tax=Ochlerotatus camptorhynchus TaxID=644619 RepID=UPI0031DCE08A